MFTNRITNSIDDVAAKFAALDPEIVAKHSKTLDLDMGDWLTFGDHPSRLMLAGVLDADEAQTLHAIHTTYNTTASVAARYVFLSVMTETLPLFIAGKA